MSAIAHILNGRGEVVTGSDRQENDATRRLRAEGVKVSIGHSSVHIGAADVVVYSAAIPFDNPEILEARIRGVPTVERPAMLGRLMEPYTHRIAVSGTHGKTTTTSMINMIFDRAGLDASALIGGDLKSLGGNARLGGGSIILTEACEAFESFLHLHPSIAVITNIEADHLDYYGTVEHVEEAFRQFVSQVDSDGCVVACWDDPRVRRVLDGCGRRIVWFGLEGEPEVLARDVDTSIPEPSYTLVRSGRALGTVRVGVPGLQNVTDSLAAAAVAFELGVEFDAIAEALRDFRGADRRFEVLFDDGDAMVVDDYAHHPSEIKATLTAARAAYDKRIIAVFQPHLYSRTKIFLNEFAEALALADEVIVAPIYAAREQPMAGVSAENIVEMMKRNGFTNVRYAPDKDALPDQLAASIGKGDMVLVLGAGDISEVGHALAGRKGGSVPFLENEPMAGHTTLGVGGPADYFVEVSSDDELVEVMRYVAANKLPCMVLGDGANLLVSDKGIRGVVIKLGEAFGQVSVDGCTITSGSAARMSRVADIAASHSLSGLEGVGTVPGSVGGAVVMNAGTHRGYIDEVVQSVSVVTDTGQKQTLSREQCGFTYRNSRFQTDRSLIITSASFTLRPGDGKAIEAHLESVRKHRAETQPQGKSAGCFFKNPPNASAGKLIEAAGGKGLREGGAEVSPIHANFIVNTGGATASDLYNLAEKVRALVREKHGIELEYEVRLVGEW